MKRNPLLTDSDGIPFCFSKASESDSVCMEDCPSDLRDRCIDQTLLADEPSEGLSEKPPCFSKEYSALDETCQNNCEFVNDCRLETKAKGEVRTEKTWLEEAKKDAQKDRFYLPVLQNKPSATVISPPVRTVAPVSYWETQYNKPYQYSSSTTTQPGLQIVLNRPTLTEEQYLHFYGAKPAPNPLIPGQFEGEAWWARLFKEFVIRSLMYSVQVAGQLIVEMVGRIRWAPKNE